MKRTQKKKRGRPSALEANANYYANAGFARAVRAKQGTLVQEQSLGRSTFAELLERGIVLARKDQWVADQRNRPAMIGRQDSSNAELHPKLDDIARYRADPENQAPVELAALVWRELKCEHERTGLEGLVPVPNDAPLVAVKMTRKQRLEAAKIDFVLPELVNLQHTWYIELEDPGRELPNGIALWKSCHETGHDLLTAGIWIEGKVGSVNDPHVVILCSKNSVEEFTRHVLVSSHLTESSEDRDRVYQRCEAKATWLTENGFRLLAAAMCLGPRKEASATLEGRTRTYDGDPSNLQDRQRVRRTMQRSRTVQLQALNNIAPANRQQLAQARTALDVLAHCARRTSRVLGPGCVGKMANRNLGQWDTILYGASIWCSLYEREQRASDEQSTRATSEEATLGTAFDPLTLHLEYAVNQARGTPLEYAPENSAILVPPKLWRAIEAAGPVPDLHTLCWKNQHGRPRTWWVELEEPTEDEPRMTVVYGNADPDGSAHTMGTFLWTKGAVGSLEAPFTVTWQLTDEGIRYSPAIVGLRITTTITPSNPLGPIAERILKKLSERSFFDRVFAAIHHQVVTTNEPTPIEPTPKMRTQWGDPTGTQERSARSGAVPDSIFAIVRMQGEAAPPADRSAGTGTRTRGPLRELHQVHAHWKRQPYGKEGKKRKIILVQEYERGPKPRDDQIVMQRLPEPRTSPE